MLFIPLPSPLLLVMRRGCGERCGAEVLSRLLPAGYLLRLPAGKRSLGKHMHAAMSYLGNCCDCSESIECAFDSDCGLVLGWTWSLRLYFGIRYDCDSFGAAVIAIMIISTTTSTIVPTSHTLTMSRLDVKSSIATRSRDTVALIAWVCKVALAG